MKVLHGTSAMALLAVFSMVFASCGGGGGGGGSQPPAADISGTWSIASTVSDNTCGDVNGVIDYFSAIISHDGTSNSFSAAFYQSSVLVASCNGTISGTSIHISNCSYPEGSGTTTSNVSGTLNIGSMIISGTDSWTYTEIGWGTCSGHSAWAATKSGGGGGQVQITNAESEPNDSTATSNIITGTLPIAISGSYVSTDDYYQLTFSSTGSRTITLTGLSSDLDLRLLNSSGGQITASANTGTVSESITYSFTGGAIYYVRVDPYLSPATTSYTLSIN